MKDIQKFNFDEVLKALSDADIEGFYRTKAAIPEAEDLRNSMREVTGFDHFMDKTVLGIDIYQYSQYHSLEQSIVPFLFKLIYTKVVGLSLEKAGFVFQKYEESQFEEQFIGTGDGGFQIFETPLHAIIFAIHFELIVRYYNSYQFYPKLRKLIGPLNLRYAMTHDHIYQFDKNYYGPSIINNNRILSKDELNRFLIDEKTFNWFMLNMSGVENLQILSIEEIKMINGFESYDIDHSESAEAMFPVKMDYRPEKNIISADVQKIGNIRVKSTALSIYNLHLQYMGGLTRREDPERKTVITLSLGNLNTSGIQ